MGEGGEEGVNHEIIDGIPHIQQVQGAWIQNSAANGDYAFNLNGYDLGDDDLNMRVLAASYGWPPERILHAYRVSSTNARVSPHVQAQLSAANAVQQTLTDKANVFNTQAVMAASADFDRVWDTGVRDWLQSGAQAVIDERRAKYPEPRSE
jgi:putative aldouronate transport system substrate-binding protein